MVDDNSNIIVKYSSGYLLNDSCDLVRIEGGDSKTFEKHAVPLFLMMKTMSIAS